MHSQSAPMFVPRQQILHLNQAQCGAQFIDAVIVSQHGDIIAEHSLAMTLKGATREAMAARSPNTIAECWFICNDCAAFSGRHVLVAVKAECGGDAEGPGLRQSSCVSRVFNDQKPPLGCKSSPFRSIRKVASVMN